MMQIIDGVRVGTRGAMMKMWKEIFHDSDDYISLLFESYFSPERVRCVYDRDKLIAMMLTIPYRFRSVKSNVTFDGLYMCGLATDPEYRGRGIMRDMIESINGDAAKSGCDFTFLIPADASLRRYYQMQNYCNYMKRNSSVVSCNDKYFCGDLKSGSVVKIIESDDCCLDSLVVLISDGWCASEGLNICHSLKDSTVIVKEHFLSGGKIAVALSSDESVISASLFYDNDGLPMIKRIISADGSGFGELIKGVMKYTGSDRVQLYDYLPSSIVPKGDLCMENRIEDYGMLRFLRDSEILKFAEIDSFHLKNRILSETRILKDSAINCFVETGEDAIIPQINISLMLD